jgi:hypothetical protein
MKVTIPVDDEEWELDAEPFFYWINERHKIYLRRKSGNSGPWTDDPILRDYRFCNVFRELDTVTIWIEENIRKPYAKHHNLWFLLAMARNTNWPGTLRQLLRETALPDEFDYDQWKSIYTGRQANGLKTFGNAYLITNGGKSMPKEDFVFTHVLKPIWDATRAGESRDFDELFDPAVNGGTQYSLEQVWKWFRNYNGFGPFIAYEVVTDLRWTRYLRNAPDIMTWANAGPGALRGLNRLAGRIADAPLRQQTALALMRGLLAVANDVGSPLGNHIPGSLEMRDIEHSLCETDKYLRAKTGEGRPKVTYDWRKAAS